jgi:hypothetical protein
LRSSDTLNKPGKLGIPKSFRVKIKVKVLAKRDYRKNFNFGIVVISVGCLLSGGVDKIETNLSPVPRS